MSGYFTVRKQRKLELKDAKVVKSKRKRQADHTNKDDSETNTTTQYYDGDSDDLVVAGSTSYLEQASHVTVEVSTIKIDPIDSYLVELRKILGVMLLQGGRSIIMPDFNDDTHKLMIVAVKRRVVYQNENENPVWLYSCYCDQTKKNLIDSLPEVIIDFVEDQCMHVSVVKMFFDNEVADEEVESIEEETFLTEISFCPSKFVVEVKGELGIISWEYGKMKCSTCNHSCLHTEFAKHNMIFPCDPKTAVDDDVRDDKLFSGTIPSVFLDDKQKYYLKKGLSGFNSQEIDGELMPYAIADIGEKCYNCETIRDYSVNSNPFKVKHFVSRNEIATFAVFDLTCKECLLVYSYDGYENGVLHYDNVLVHHSVLRDYMFHFLNGNSCTLHSFYEVWKHHQEDHSNETFSKIIRYDKWRQIWYSFLNLLDINLESERTRRAFQCPQCGPELDMVVCDATTLGFQRKYMLIAFPDKVIDHEEKIPRATNYLSRIAISDTATRDLLRKWCLRKCRPNELPSLTCKLSSYPEIYEAFLWTTQAFPLVVPKGVNQLFKSLATASPVCAYFRQGEDIGIISDELFKSDVKSKFNVVSKIKETLPLFYDVLFDLFEPCLPKEWKSLVGYLFAKSNEPFDISKKIPEFSKGCESNMQFFPTLPIHRGRGNFEMDNEKNIDVCNKDYKGHHKRLMPGIFTLYCEHGINYGFEVMRSAEFTNVPFTIFKTRFTKAPTTIIYDNACSLHNYCLNRDPYFFRNSNFYVDRFHWANHKGIIERCLFSFAQINSSKCRVILVKLLISGCSIGYYVGLYSNMTKVNTQVNEQQNAAIKKLKTQLSYMAPKNFVAHCTFFLWYKNTVKNKSL